MIDQQINNTLENAVNWYEVLHSEPSESTPKKTATFRYLKKLAAVTALAAAASLGRSHTTALAIKRRPRMDNTAKLLKGRKYVKIH